MTVWFCVTSNDIAELSRLGAPPPGNLWSQRGFIAVFSCNSTKVWRTPAYGKTTARNFPGDLTGRSTLLDRIVAQARALKPTGSRLLVAPEGVYLDHDGARELIVGFLDLERSLSVAMQPRVDP